MDKVSLFSSLLATDKLSVDNLNLEMFAYEQMRMTDGRKYTNRGGWQSNFVDNLPQVQPLIEQINQRLEQLRNDIQFVDQVFLRVESMWININHPNSYNSSHIHPNSYISGVYYVKVPYNSGNLILNHPSNLISIFTPPELIKHFNLFNSSIWNIKPNVGDLVMFPSWIEHEVTQNLSNNDRISIAFNASFYKSE